MAIEIYPIESIEIFDNSKQKFKIIYHQSNVQSTSPQSQLSSSYCLQESHTTQTINNQLHNNHTIQINKHTDDIYGIFTIYINNKTEKTDNSETDNVIKDEQLKLYREKLSSFLSTVRHYEKITGLEEIYNKTNKYIDGKTHVSICVEIRTNNDLQKINKTILEV